MSGPALAVVYKCTDDGGHVTYSEAPCPGQPSVRMDLKDVIEDRQPARAATPGVATQAPPDSSASASSPAAAGNGYELSYSDRQRIANLEQVERRTTAYPEQRRSAALEIRSIRRGTIGRMSADDLRKKDNYWVDLGSLDADKRRTAAAQLANLFAAYP
ncbi:MAG: DUF4124 domain-containing protein [Betaproteobacteria bacterium]